MSPSDQSPEIDLLTELSRINNEYGVQQRQALQELARTRRELAAAHGALGMVAHDLRAPLQAVLGFAEFLLDEDLDDHQRELAERIGRAAAQMSELADELVDTMAPTTPASRKPVDLVAVVDDLTSRYQLLGAERGVQVRADVAASASAAQVAGEENHLRRVLENLIGNAVKFSPDGGVVTVRVARDGDTVALSVADQGPGIPVEEQQAVFERFHRTAAAAHLPGLGLGLSIVRHLVEQHDGTVELRSDAGQGSVFTVRLPAASS